MAKKFGLVIDNPDLIAEWDWEENSKIGLDPAVVTCGLETAAFWKCHVCGHKWKSKIYRRNKGSGCKKCRDAALRRAPKEESLAALFPEIAKEWNFEKNDVTPDAVYPNSNKTYWWICEKGHDYDMTASKRTGRKYGCPICSNHKVCVGFNDLQTTYPQLLEEWDYEKNEAIGLRPTEVTYGCEKHAYWKCQRGHRWSARIYTRTTGACGCPKCNKELRISYPEKIIAHYLRLLFPDSIENYRSPELNNQEIDIFIASLNLGVEYDGKRWHKDPKKDQKKDDLCKRLGIKLIRVREKGCGEYESEAIKVYVDGKSDEELSKAIKYIVDFINKAYSLHKSCDINIQRDGPSILSTVLSKKKENSIAKSNLIEEWDSQRNKGINPECVPSFSNDYFWWICKKCGFSFRAQASKRSIGRGCPYCSGQKVMPGFNDLETLYPEIAKEWDAEKNELKPNQVTAKTGRKFHWICSKCGHRWKTGIYTRTAGGCGCPECKKRSISIKNGRKVKNLDTGIVYESIITAGRELGIHPGSISNCCRGLSKTAGGFHWGYAEK